MCEGIQECPSASQKCCPSSMRIVSELLDVEAVYMAEWDEIVGVLT